MVRTSEGEITWERTNDTSVSDVRSVMQNLCQSAWKERCALRFRFAT